MCSVAMKQYFIIRHKVQVISIQTIFHYILSFKTLKPIRNSNIFCFLWILPTSSGVYWYFFFMAELHRGKERWRGILHLLVHFPIG